MSAIKRILVSLTALSLTAMALSGCTNADGYEYVTLPDSYQTSSYDPYAVSTSDFGYDTSVTTSPDGADPNGDYAPTTFVAVVMDNEGNIVTDENGVHLTTIIEVTRPASETESGDISGQDTGISGGSGIGAGSGSSLSGEKPPLQTGGTVYTSERTVLYADPNDPGSIVGELAENTAITILSAMSDDWYAVSANGSLGYLHASVLRTDYPENPDDPNGNVSPNGEITTTTPTTTSTTTTTTTTITTTTTTAKKTTTTAKKTTTTTKKTTTTAKKTTTTAKKTTTTAKKTTTTAKKATTTAAVTTVKLPYDSTTNEYINEVVKLVNAERAKNGLAPLKIDLTLTKAAMTRANEIIKTFDHVRPNGESFYTALKSLGIYYHKCGENIAYGYPTPSSVVKGWMNSSGHRANILSSEFTHIGIGYYCTSDGCGYWVQEFCSYFD